MADSYLPPVIANLLADVTDFVANWQAAAQAAQESAAEIAAARELANGGPDGAAASSANQEAIAAANADVAASEQAVESAADGANTSLAEQAELVNSAAASQADFANEVDDASTAVEEESAAVSDATGDLAAYTAAAEAAAAASTQFGGGALIVGSALDEVAQGLVSMRPGFDEYGRSLTDTAGGMRTMIGQAGKAQTGLGELQRSFEESAPAGRNLGQSASEAGRAVVQAGQEAEQGAAAVTRSGQAAHGAETGWVGLFNLMSHGPDIIDGVTAAVSAAVPVLTGMAVGLTAFATGAGVAALGLDGLEQSANLMDAALTPLKEAASQAFEKTLLPAVTDVSRAAPEMKTQVTDAATAIGGMLKSLADIATSSQGVQDLNRWLEGTADFFNEGKRGSEQFAESVLTFLSAAAPAMQQFGADFADVEADWNRLIEKAASTGEITKAVEGAGAAFKGFMEMVGRTVDAMMKLSADVGPNLGDMFKSIGDAIEAIEPPISMFIKGFTMGIEVVAQMVKAAEGVAEPFSVIAGILAALGIGFKVFEWVLAPINQTIRLIRLLGTAITDTSGLSVLWAKFTDAIGLTEGAAKKAQAANLSAAETLKLEGDAAEKAAAKNLLFTDSLKAKGDAAEIAAGKIALATDALKLEGDAAEGAAAKNALMAESAAGTAGKVAGAGAAAEGAAADLAGAGAAAETAGAGLAEAGGAEGAGALIAGLSAIQPEVGLVIAGVAALAVAGTAVVQNWPAISQTIDDVGARIKEQVRTWPQETGKELGDVAAFFYNARTSIYQTVSGMATDIFATRDRIYQNLSQFGQWVSNSLPKSWGEWRQSSEEQVKGLEAFFTQTVPNIVNGLVSGIKDGADAVGNAFGELWDSAKAEFDKKAGIQSPSTVMAASGKDIVDGLVAGIYANMAYAVRTIEKLSEELMAAVKNKLGIQSPSVEFFGIGHFMMEGWSQGIIAGAGKVTDAVRQVSQGALAAGQAGAASAAVGAAGGALLGGSPGVASGPLQLVLRVEGNDSAMAAQIQSMFRKGQIRISANNIVRGRAYS